MEADSRVTKVDVVSRQVREAVRLFFEERDPIVVHTVVASAHQILFDLGKRAGITSAVKNVHALQQEDVQSFLKTINQPFNFFKHADQDPEGAIFLGPLQRLTADFLLDAVVMLQQIAGRIPAEAKVFWAWFVSFYPEEFDDLPKNGEIARMQAMNLGELSFPEIVAVLKMSAVVPDADV